MRNDAWEDVRKRIEDIGIEVEPTTSAGSSQKTPGSATGSSQNPSSQAIEVTMGVPQAMRNTPDWQKRIFVLDTEQFVCEPAEGDTGGPHGKRNYAGIVSLLGWNHLLEPVLMEVHVSPEARVLDLYSNRECLDASRLANAIPARDLSAFLAWRLPIDCILAGPGIVGDLEAVHIRLPLGQVLDTSSIPILKEMQDYAVRTARERGILNPPSIPASTATASGGTCAKLASLVHLFTGVEIQKPLSAVQNREFLVHWSSEDAAATMLVLRAVLAVADQRSQSVMSGVDRAPRGQSLWESRTPENRGRMGVLDRPVQRASGSPPPHLRDRIAELEPKLRSFLLQFLLQGGKPLAL